MTDTMTNIDDVTIQAYGVALNKLKVCVITMIIMIIDNLFIKDIFRVN